MEVFKIEIIRKMDFSANSLNNDSFHKSKKLERYVEEFVGSAFSKILKNMDRTIIKSGLLKENNAEKWFKDMLYDEYSTLIAKENFKDITQKIMNQLSLKSYNIYADK